MEGGSMVQHSKLYLMLLIVMTAIGGSTSFSAPETARAIDTQHSSITVRVFKSGLFSTFAHNHIIRAPIRQGKASDTAVELVVESGKMTVTDPEISETDRAKIQSTMLGPEVLDSKRFLEIRFRSTSMKQLSKGKWRVQGELSLHGETKPVAVDVSGDSSHYTGKVQLKQTIFGIKPIRIAGGTITIKDEVEVEFDVKLAK
jgi:polyisoprenoid-binding protein YceI